jgi:hypothetical protein
MLRKYGIGLLAVIIAVGSAAFTAPKKSGFAATHVFEFNNTLSYTIPNVTNTSNTNWKYVGEIGQKPLCSGINKACRVAVSDAYVNNPSAPTALSGVTLTASTSGTGDAVVASITNGPSNMYSNQP